MTFFHRSACVWLNFNFMRKIVIKGSMIEELEVVKEKILNFCNKKKFIQ